MAIDAYPVPAESRVFTRQNLFQGIYKPPLNDAINVNLYQDFAYSMVGNKGYFAMATGLNVVLNHVFEFGAFCSYIPEVVRLTDTEHTDANGNNTLILSSYFYCGNMLSYVPLADKRFHPKLWLDIGLGNAHGVSLNATKSIQNSVNYIFFVIKPAIALEMNFFSFLQWTAAVQYRLQFAAQGPSNDLGIKASGLEVSTGPVIHF